MSHQEHSPTSDESRIFLNKAEYYTPHEPNTFNRFRTLIDERLPDRFEPEVLGELIRGILSDTESLLIVSGTRGDRAARLTDALNADLLNEDDRALIEQTAQLARSILATELTYFLKYSAPSEQWVARVGALHGEGNSSIDPEDLLNFNPTDYLQLCESVRSQLRKAIEQKGISTFSSVRGDRPSYGYGQIEANGGIALVFESTGVELATPWGQLCVVHLSEPISDQIIKDFSLQFGLEPIEAELNLVDKLLFNAERYSITKVPGVETTLPAAVFVPEHAKRNNDEVQREWLAISGEAAPEVGRLLRTIAQIKDLDQAGNLEEAEELLCDLMEEAPVHALPHLIPLITSCSEDISSSIIFKLDSESRNIVVKDALREQVKVIADYLENALDSGTYSSHSGAPYTTVSLIRTIAPAGAERFVPLLMKAAVMHADPQWECQALGEFGADAQSAVSMLRNIAQSDAYWPSYYARKSIGQIQAALQEDKP